MKFFRETTTGDTVIMGRKTFESIGGCLPNRNNVVLSHNNVLFSSSAHCKLVLSLGEALFTCQDFGTSDAYVIGGALTYHQFAPFVDRYLVTIIDHEVLDADAFLNDDILRDIGSWERNRLFGCGASPEKDDYSFEVFEVIAPNVEARMERRQRLIDEYESAIPRKQRRRSMKRTESGAMQEAFGF